LISKLLRISAAVVAAAAAAAGHTTMPARAAPQRHLANRHAPMRVFGSDSYALLFLIKQSVVVVNN